MIRERFRRLGRFWARELWKQSVVGGCLPRASTVLRTGDVMASPSAPSISEHHLNGPHDSGSPLAELENPHNQILNLNGNGKAEHDVVVPNGEGHEEEDESVEVEEEEEDDEGSETEGETTVEDVKGKGRVAETEGHESVAESTESQDDDEEADDDEQEEEEDDSEPVLKYEPLPVSLSDLLKRDSLSAHALSPHSIVRLSSTLIQIYTDHPHRHWEHMQESFTSSLTLELTSVPSDLTQRRSKPSYSTRHSISSPQHR